MTGEAILMMLVAILVIWGRPGGVGSGAAAGGSALSKR
mgnify:CR=1 FL=1